MAARKRNRRLLAELRSHTFYPTVAACLVWFSIINDEVFGNKLAPIDIKVQRMKGTWGYYEDSVPLIIITDQFPSKNLFLNVLAHELVHAYQHQHGHEINHGKSFWEWRKRFSQNGLALAIKYDGRSIT